jgi:hypothetical protein
MRTRRQIIKVGGTAAVLGVAGCLEDVPEEDEGGDKEGNDTDTGDGNETVTDGEDEETDMEGNETETEDEPEPASFSVVSTNAPSEVEVGQNRSWSFTVENTGGTEGSFETSVTRRGPGGVERVIDTVSVDVPAGEQVSYTGSVRHDYVGSYVYTLDETGDEFEVAVEEATLNFGESYINPDDASVTVDGTEEFYEVNVTRSYTYRDENDRRRIQSASEGMRYAIVSVECTKEGRDVVEMPRLDEFTMFVGEDAYDPVDRKRDDEYEGGSTRSMSVSGTVMFEIDERYDRSSTFEVYWTRDYEGGKAEAIWTT